VDIRCDDWDSILFLILPHIGGMLSCDTTIAPTCWSCAGTFHLPRIDWPDKRVFIERPRVNIHRGSYCPLPFFVIDFFFVDSVLFDVFFIDLSLVTCVPPACFAAMIAPRS
jgi:hypothetical protein